MLKPTSPGSTTKFAPSFERTDFPTVRSSGRLFVRSEPRGHMKAVTQIDEASLSLEERLNAHICILQTKLSSAHPPEEIQKELTILDDLLINLSDRDRWLEKLLDFTTPNVEARQIVEHLPEPTKRVVEDRQELQRLHSVSHELIERSVRLVITAQRLVDRTRSLASRYAREVCGSCTGFGRIQDSTCPACKGERSILVHQPARRCPRCKGNGRADESEPSVRCYGVCTVCIGSGWALRLPDREDRS